jgi:hypothetical protein
MKDLFLVLVLLALLFGLGACTEATACYNSTSNLMYNNQPVMSHYDLFSGCMITLPDGNSMPLDNFRFMGE